MTNAQKNTDEPPSDGSVVASSSPCASHDGRSNMGTCCLDDLTAHTSLATQQQKASALSCIAFKLPEWKAVSGSVISHAIRVIENLFSLWAPMIFKIGITHDPVWRWSNPIYGYSSARDKWSNMVVYYCSSEPFGPAMLEAALIEKYHSTASLV